MDATTTNAPVLEVRKLTKRFGGLTAVKDLSLDLRAGEIFGLIGPNGSGKSTAMKSIMGIERPTSGDVIFVAAVSDRKLRAIDLQTGRVLWSQRLPEGGQATPITYRAPRSGRQMVVIVSGSLVDLLGVHSRPMHVMAYALPN